MFTTLLMFIPEEAYALVLVFVGLLMIIGFRQLALQVFGTVLLLAFFGPFIDAIIDALPPWLFALLMFCFVVSLVRLIFGRGVSDRLISNLLYDLLMAPFRFMRWLFRGVGPRRLP